MTLLIPHQTHDVAFCSTNDEPLHHSYPTSFENASETILGETTNSFIEANVEHCLGGVL